MFQIRRNTFETNSSTTHCICLCTGSDYDKFVNGELWYDRYHEDLVTKEQINANLRRYDPGADMDDMDEEALQEEGYYTYESYNDKITDYYEDFVEEFTTPGGDKVVAFGYYGRD